MHAWTLDRLVGTIQDVVSTISDAVGIPSTATWLLIAGLLFLGIVAWAYRT
jgi:hypothetical protein